MRFENLDKKTAEINNSIKRLIYYGMDYGIFCVLKLLSSLFTLSDLRRISSIAGMATTSYVQSVFVEAH